MINRIKFYADGIKIVGTEDGRNECRRLSYGEVARRGGCTMESEREKRLAAEYRRMISK